MRDLDHLEHRAGLDREVDPARTPGRQTLVDADPRRGAAQPGVPGRRTLVPDAGDTFESAVADATRYTGELEGALARTDRAKVTQAATSLDAALGIVRETIANGRTDQAAQHMQATIELFVHAEPLLAKARALGASPEGIAARGTAGPGHELPHLDRIQQSFGRHDVSHVQAHVGGDAAAASAELGARAYAHGSSVAFAGTPDLHTAAHEAAHVVQQRGGVSLKAIDGGAGESHEQHADAVADAVVAGRSAETLLDRGPAGAPAVQRKETGPTEQKDGAKGGAEDRGGRKAKGAGAAPKDSAGHGGGKGASAKGAGGATNASAAAPGGSAIAGSGGIDGKPLKAQLAQLGQQVTANTNTVQTPEGVHGDPKKDSEEDHGKKVAQYRDGIDGIADMIGDLDAFDDLCDACSWGGDQGKQAAAMGRIRQSKPFHQLSQMWQGALDGGQDSPAMQAAFEREFTSRGFWGSTQQAYQLVRDAAKAQAKEDAAAAEAKKKAQQAKGKGEAKGVDGKDGGKTTAGKPNAHGADGGAAGAAGGAGLDAVVQHQAAAIPAFEQLKSVKDADFKHVMDAADHHAGLAESAPALGTEAPRTGQILQQLERAGSGFTESFGDTVKWGVIAHFGDKLIGGAVEKTLGEKVPIIGPLIMLAVDPPWTGKYWSDTGKGFSAGWKSLKSAFDMSAFKSCHSAGDFVGVLCAKVADLFSTFYQWLNTINKLLGTLSAICLILGAVLIGIGIALAWLGVGAGLMAAGGWLVEAGEVLGDISMALVPVCLALSGLSLVFRTAASFLVPSDVYADQLAQEGEAADQFGKMAGQKAGLDTSRTIESATASKPEAKTEGGSEGGTGEQAKGAEDGAAIAEDVKGGNDALQETAQQAQAKAQEHAGGEQKPADAPAEAKPEAKPEAKTEETAETKPEEKTEHSDKDAKTKEQEKGEEKDGEKEEAEGEEEGKQEGEEKKSLGEKLKAAAKDLGRRLLESAKVSLSLGRNLRRLGDALAEVPELAKGRQAADRGLSTRKEMIEGKVESAREALEETGKQAEEHQQQIDELLDKLTNEEGSLSEEEVADLNKQLGKALDAWGEARESGKHLEAKLKGLEKALEHAKAGEKDPNEPSEEQTEESDASKDESGKKKSTEEKRRALEDEARAKREELAEAEHTQARLEKQIETSEQALEAAKAQKAKAEVEAEAAVQKLEAEKPEQKAAADKVEAHDAAKQRAKELREKAGKIESAEMRRKSAQRKLEKQIGKTVELAGEPHEIVGVGPEGVTVKSRTGVERTVKPEEITGGDLPSDFKQQVDRFMKAQQQLAELTEGEHGGNAGAIAKEMQKQATQIERSEAPSKSPKKQAEWRRTKDQAKEFNDAKAKAEEPAQQADEAVERAEKTLEQQREQLAETKAEAKQLEREASKAEGENHELRREAQRHRRVEKAREKGFEGAPELIAWAVGLFSEKGKEKVEHAFELPSKGMDWLMKVTTLEDRLHQLKGVISTKVESAVSKVTSPLFVGGATEEQEKLLAEQDAAGGHEGGEEKKEGEETPEGGAPAVAKDEHEETKEKEQEGGEKEGEGGNESEKLRKEALRVGHGQALYEQLSAMRPPPDIALLGDHRKKAAAASVRYYQAHAWAYKCYQAELSVGKLAQDTAQLAAEGKPLQKQSQQSRGPIEKSKADEQQRQQTLAGAQTGDVKGSDSRMGGMVMGLISKIGDNSDHLSQKPDAGGASGDQMASGQDKADTESKQRTAQGKSHSQGQQQFLDQALQMQARQEQSVGQSIQTLEAKQQQELASRDQIRQHKAQALADEAAARAECETESATFNEGYARASAWAEAYEAKRKDVKAGGGGD